MKQTKNTFYLIIFLYIIHGFAIGISSFGAISSKVVLFVLKHPHLYLVEIVAIIAQLLLPLIFSLMVAFASKLFKYDAHRVFNYTFLITGLLLSFATILPMSG